MTRRRPQACAILVTALLVLTPLAQIRPVEAQSKAAARTASTTSDVDYKPPPCQ